MHHRPFEVLVRVNNFDIKNKKLYLTLDMSYTEKLREIDLRKQVYNIAHKMLKENGIEKDLNTPEYQIEILLGHTVDKLARQEELLNDCFYLLNGIFSTSDMSDDDKERYDLLMSKLKKEVNISIMPHYDE